MATTSLDPGTYSTLTQSQKDAANGISNTPTPTTTLAQDQAKAANQGKPGYDVLGNPIHQSPTSNPVATQSTTTLSSNKTNDIAGIQNTTQGLTSSGVTTNFDAQGNPITTYANNTPYSPGAKNDPIAANTNGVSNGGYVGEVYYPVGTTLPKDSTGNYASATPYSPTDVQTVNSLNELKTKADALTASTIDNITSQYQTLIKNQQQVNQGYEASTKMGLIRSGALKGDVYSNNSLQAAVNYGTSQIADLQSKMQTAIIAAQTAGQNQDFQLQDKMNQVAIDAQKNMRDVATKMQDQITAQNQKLADAQLQASKDNAIVEQFSGGVTDPSTILRNLRTSGDTTTTLGDIKSALGVIATNNGIDTSKLSADAQEFFTLKNQPGGLPVSILHLGSTAEQLAAYIKLKNQASAAGSALGKAVDTSSVSGAGSLANALVSQESGGNYNAVNPDSGALGKYQIMPSNLAAYAVGADGKPLTTSSADQQYFLNNPSVQDEAFQSLLADLTAKYNGDPAKIAAAYYGGDGAVQVLGTPAGDKPQGKYPSINAYVKSVIDKMNVGAGTLGSGQIDTSVPGYATQAIASAGGLTQAAIDKAAIQYAMTGTMPSVGLGSTGAAAAKRDAIQNRAAELDTNGQISSNKAKLTASTKALTTQTDYLNSVQRALGASEGGGNWIVKNAPKGINSNDSTFLNTKLNDLTKKYGNSENIRSYQAALYEIGNEYAQVFARGGARSVEGNSKSQEILSGDISMKDLKGVLDTLQEIGKINLDASNTQVSSIQNDINNIVGGGGLYKPTSGSTTSSTSGVGGSKGTDFLGQPSPLASQPAWNVIQ